MKALVIKSLLLLTLSVSATLFTAQANAVEGFSCFQQSTKGSLYTIDIEVRGNTLAVYQSALRAHFAPIHKEIKAVPFGKKLITKPDLTCEQTSAQTGKSITIMIKGKNVQVMRSAPRMAYPGLQFKITN